MYLEKILVKRGHFMGLLTVITMAVSDSFTNFWNPAPHTLSPNPTLTCRGT